MCPVAKDTDQEGKAGHLRTKAATFTLYRPLLLSRRGFFQRYEAIVLNHKK